MVVFLSHDILPRVRMTVDEYLEAELPEGFRYELVDGVIEVSPVPNIPHDVPIGFLNRLFGRYADRRPDIVGHITQRSALALRQRPTAREPDFAVYATGQVSARPGVSWKQLTPLLIVEIVSPGQAERDYRAKRADYWDAAVPEYWIVDPDAQTLTLLSRGETDWVERTLGQTETLQSAQFPGLTFVVGNMLRGELPPQP